MAAAIAQTIAVVDKSGKVVSTSKQLRNVFLEAKFAYQERKAEIIAERKAKARSVHEPKDLRRAATTAHHHDNRSERSHSTRRQHRTRHSESERRSRPEAPRRRRSLSSIDSPRTRPQRGEHGSPPSHSSHRHRRSATASFPASDAPPRRGSAPTSPTSPTDGDGPRRSVSLVRRCHTDLELDRVQAQPLPHAGTGRSMSTPNVDLDLAYGEYHPECIAPLPDTDPATEKEFLTLVERAKLLLDEAQCAQHSVQAMIAHLQKNPEAMAAVALTLAEISNLASKMAPGALAMLKGSAPAVFALLASPQFLIAAGVGIGVTVVMFGGYKIIKKIRAKNGAKEDGSMDEMVELDGDEISRIQKWRRGIVAAGGAREDAVGPLSPVGAPSDVTSVEGEFITPLAAASMRGDGQDEPLSEKERRKRSKKEKKEKKESKEHSNATKRESKKDKKKDRASSGAGDGDDASSRDRATKEARADDQGGDPDDDTKLSSAESTRRALVKVKKPSPLRRLLA